MVPLRSKWLKKQCSNKITQNSINNLFLLNFILYENNLFRPLFSMMMDARVALRFFHSPSYHEKECPFRSDWSPALFQEKLWNILILQKQQLPVTAPSFGNGTKFEELFYDWRYARYRSDGSDGDGTDNTDPTQQINMLCVKIGILYDLYFIRSTTMKMSMDSYQNAKIIWLCCQIYNMCAALLRNEWESLLFIITLFFFLLSIFSRSKRTPSLSLCVCPLCLRGHFLLFSFALILLTSSQRSIVFGWSFGRGTELIIFCVFKMVLFAHCHLFVRSFVCQHSTLCVNA